MDDDDIVVNEKKTNQNKKSTTPQQQSIDRTDSTIDELITASSATTSQEFLTPIIREQYTPLITVEIKFCFI